MTQMNLADEMGVSYQAVSNWERGNSMPDISKLPELCKILNISFEELVGEKTDETEIAVRLMQKDEEVTLEEMSQIAQLVQPDIIEDKVTETLEKKSNISLSTLAGLAPFLDSKTLEKMAEELALSDVEKLCGIAPFLSEETLDRIVDNSIKSGNFCARSAVGLAPFLAKSTVNKIVQYLIEHGKTDEIGGFAPFMGRGVLKNHLMNIEVEDDDQDEDDIRELLLKAIRK